MLRSLHSLLTSYLHNLGKPQNTEVNKLEFLTNIDGYHSCVHVNADITKKIPSNPYTTMTIHPNADITHVSMFISKDIWLMFIHVKRKKNRWM